MNDCIMNIGDYILRGDVLTLPENQWNQFRSYLRSYGHPVNEHYGQISRAYKCDIVLDEDGDLVWQERPPRAKQITKLQILQAIDQMNPTISRHQLLTDINNKIKQHEDQIISLRQQYLEATKRQTGRSTAIALATIAEALKKPNCNQFFVDHDNNPRNNTQLALTIEEIINKLGLSDLYVNSDKMFVRYSQFGQQAK